MLENLTDEQCVHIAKIAYPEIDWVVTRLIRNWKGRDLVEEASKSESNKYKHNFQIDFRESQEEIRFRYYNHEYQQTIVSDEVKQEIYNYISTLEPEEAPF